MTLSPRLLALLVSTNLATLGALGLLLLCGFARQDPSRFTRLTAERIDIVDADGRTVMALSNRARIAAPRVGGKEYPLAVSEGRELMAGMIFFNQDGDEMGGLVFNSFRRPDGKAAGIGHLSFDRFQDNQVVALQYKENASGVQSGLTVYDRPGDGSFRRSLDLIEQARGSGDTGEARAALADLAGSGALGCERVFVGSKDERAQLLLKDARGRVRARLAVDSGGAGRLEFLDADGAVYAHFPE